MADDLLRAWREAWSQKLLSEKGEAEWGLDLQLGVAGLQEPGLKNC